LAMEMEFGNDRAAGPSWLGYYTANLTRAMCASPALGLDQIC